MVALQCCVGFCYTTTWTSHNFIYIYIERGHIYISIYIHIKSPLSRAPSPLLFHHSRSSQTIMLGSLFYTATFHQLSVLHNSADASMLLSQILAIFPSPTVSTSRFSMSVFPFFPCKWIHQYYFSWTPYIYTYMCVCVLVNNICFVFLIYFTLYNKLYLFIHLITTDSNSFFFMSAPILTFSLTPHTMKRTLVKSNTR